MSFDASFLFSAERLEQARAWQNELRVKYGENKLPEAVGRLAYALRCQESVRQNIATQQSEGDTEGLKHSYSRLAELLIESGQFAEAAEVGKQGDRADIQERAERLQEALVKDDSESCECKNLNSKLPTTFIRQTFMIDGAMKTQVKCSKCGLSNVRELRDGDVATRAQEDKANNR